jgi:hypothetical protein
LESAEPQESGGNPASDRVRHDDETVIPPLPGGSPSSVEAALAQYADSIERLSAESGTELDHYTRGFIAGLRAAIKVAENVNRA